ncbi:MAG: nitroreductase family deazaflavin-dependent oxidoreductase [Anaerolineales bacterium]|jgi:deazaflavin-dependent oxidoreductase (nitroreductase family)
MLKFFMAIQVWLYRLSKGRLGGRMRGFNVLLLTTVGRRSGKTRTLPLGLFDWPDGYLVVASNSGQPKHPSWYLNLMSHPQATVQVLDKVVPVTAEVLTGETRAKAWQQVITTAPTYADYEQKTTRLIPLVLLRPSN